MIPEQGWQCPICKRVYNPRQEMCLYCGGGTINKPVTSTKPLQQGGEISWDTISGYCNTDLSSAKINNSLEGWTTVTSSCGAIDSAAISNNVSINGTELETAIKKSVEENLNATTVRKTTD